MNFREELNEEQYAAVTAPDGPALVVAAAGTGKTRTLVYRLAWLVRERGAHPWEILLLTFTNKAAREMLHRAEELVRRSFNSGYSGTFHAFANRLLRRHAEAVGFSPDYTILDADDAKKLLRACIDEAGLKKEHTPKPEVLLSLFGVVTGTMADLAESARERFAGSLVDPEKVVELHERYQQRKREQNAMDFDDLLRYAHRLLRDHEEIRRFYRGEFRYVLVDEYQDTNRLQAELVRLLVAEHGNVMAVGDDFQSIYSWRGADYRNFLEFEQCYPGARIFKLQINYRSTPGILAVANAVIENSPQQLVRKQLRPVRGGGEKPLLLVPRDGTEQARAVIALARRFHEEEGVAYSDMCVLYRAHFHALELQMELARSRLPYLVTSGVRFFEQAHIKDVCSLLRILANPADELAFRRLVELLPRVGARRSHRLFHETFGGRVNLRRPETHEKLLEALPEPARPAWEAIRPVCLAWEEENLAEDPGEIIYRFVKAFYGEYLLETFENARFRSEDIDGLIDFTARFESVEDFLSEIALLTNLDAEGAAAPGEEAPDALRLSTVHQAKGLEWKVVFLLFLNDEMFPGRRAVEGSAAALAEERRLFYVAVTRARDRLVLCAPRLRRQRDGGIIFLEPSPFLEEIDEELLEPVTRLDDPFSGAFTRR